jgi:hypothetical protein
MTRSILALAVAVGLTGALAGQGCKQTGVGDPCVPEQEYDKTFNGFDQNEVNIESKSFQCQTRLCLVNHFQGRVSCVYGQDVSGNPPGPPGGKQQAAAGQVGGSCSVPGDPKTLITGNPDPTNKLGATVSPQCFGREAEKTVYCSCRCANIDGKTDDGSNYCTCPDGYGCTQLVTSIGGNFNEGLTGAYCVKNSTIFDRANPCTTNCDPTAQVCESSSKPYGQPD